MADAESIKAGLRSAFRDFRIDGVPASGEHEPVKRDIRDAITKVADLAQEAKDDAASAGTTILADTRAELDAKPGPFEKDARAEVRRDPAGNVENGNGVYRYSGTTWVWRDHVVPLQVQDSMTDAAVEEAGGLVHALIRQSNTPLLNLADEAGFERRFLTEDMLDLPGETIATPVYEINGQGDGLVVMDGDGFVGWRAGADADRRSLETRGMVIGNGDLVLGVGDEMGFFPVYVPAGRSLGPTDEIEARIRALEAGGGAGWGRAWPRIQTAGVEVSAHRGVWEGTAAPENSLDALRLAARLGYRHPEADIRRTSDGQFVIMHDDTINRTMRMADSQTVIPAPVVIASNTLAQLRSGYVMASSDPAMRRPIPTLDEYLRLAKSLGVKPILEVKDEALTHPQIESLVMQAVEVLGWDGLIFTSFYQNILDYIRTLNADVALYYILHFNSANIDHVASQRGVFNASAALLTDALVKEAHRKGVRVACWTVAPNDFAAVLALGVDEMTSNSVAPRLRDQAVAWSVQSGPGSWDGWTTTGVETDGVIQLAAGQVLTLDASSAPTVDMGAWYLSVDYSGTAKVTAPGVASADRTQADPALCCFQNRLSGKPFLAITAGAGGAHIRNAAFAVAAF